MIIGMSMKIYYKKDIAEILDRPLRTITQWIDSGFIVPDVEDSRGKGKARIFSERNVIEFAMFDIMSRVMGIKQEQIKYILDHLKGLKSEGFGDWLNYDEIQDFYTNTAWGFSKELTCAFDAHYSLITKNIIRETGTFLVMEGRRYGEEEEYVYDQDDSMWGTAVLDLSRFDDPAVKISKYEIEMIQNIMVNKNIFRLGSIKNIAIRHFNITI